MATCEYCGKESYTGVGSCKKSPNHYLHKWIGKPKPTRKELERRIKELEFLLKECLEYFVFCDDWEGCDDEGWQPCENCDKCVLEHRIKKALKETENSSQQSPKSTRKMPRTTAVSYRTTRNTMTLR